jgi:hypothetical protein
MTPLVLLPGVGLLVMSTSARYGQIHQEFHHLLTENSPSGDRHASDLWRRAVFFRNALVGLYIAVACLAIGSMLGGLASLWSAESLWFVHGLTIAGVLGVVYSAIELVRESVLSLEVLRRHRERLGD